MNAAVMVASGHGVASSVSRFLARAAFLIGSAALTGCVTPDSAPSSISTAAHVDVKANQHTATSINGRVQSFEFAWLSSPPAGAYHSVRGKCPIPYPLSAAEYIAGPPSRPTPAHPERQQLYWTYVVRLEGGREIRFIGEESPSNVIGDQGCVTLTFPGTPPCVRLIQSASCK
jgi:hypothetical protein